MVLSPLWLILFLCVKNASQKQSYIRHGRRPTEIGWYEQASNCLKLLYPKGYGIDQGKGWQQSGKIYEGERK